MRLSRLDLKRYGRFTDAVIDFPAGTHDFHLVFGPNEAGKSTTLSAISDLLYGISHNSPYNFLHSYGDMRIGAVLENPTSSIEFFRRKGKKETLLSGDGTAHPLGDGALSPFLGGYDRVFFERMFSLDYPRLNEGGRELLEARDDAGQILFSAGTGIAGLRKHLDSIEAKLDGLWGARRSSKRKYSQLEERLKDNERILREHSLSGSKWLSLKEEVSRIRDECDRVDRQILEKTLSLRKMERVRRVFRDLVRFDQIESEIASIGQLPFLPGNAREKLESAQEKITGARIQGETLKERLEHSISDRKKILPDEKILSRANEIARLHEVRIHVQKALEDLPKRQSELLSMVGELRSLARELSWETLEADLLLSMIPPRSRSVAVSKRLSERVELLSFLSAAERALMEARAAQDGLQKRQLGMMPPVDLTGLESALSAYRNASHLLSPLESFRKERSEHDSEIRLRLASLVPSVRSLEDLLSIHPPGMGRIHEFQDRFKDWELMERDRSRKVEAARQEIGSLSASRDGIFQRERLVTKDILESLREKRNQAWEVVKYIHVHGAPPPGSGTAENPGKKDPVSSFEELQREVDVVSDRRFDNAHFEASVRVIAQKLDEQQGLLDELLAQDQLALGVREGLFREWKDLWEGAPFFPDSPEVMLKWAMDREALLELSSRRELCEEKIRMVSGEISSLRSRFERELLSLEEKRNLTGEESLEFLVEMSEKRLRELSEGASLWKLLNQQVQKGEEEVNRRQLELDLAIRRFREWESRWENAVREIGIVSSRDPEAVSQFLEIIDRMRVLEEPVRDLTHRVRSIQKDADDFHGMVRSLVPLVAPDLSGETPDDSMRIIEKRLEQSQMAVELCQQKDQDILSIEKSIRHYRELDREGSETIRTLLEAANVPDGSSLAEVILKKERMLALEAEKELLSAALFKNGDGYSFPDLRRECEEIPDPALLAELVEEGTGEMESLRSHYKVLLEERTRLNNAFSSLGGDLLAVEAASDRQRILSEMREVAEQVVYLKGSSILLRWSIDRYRKEHQGPLLSRASVLFSRLTLGSLESLVIDYDDEDRMWILGFRPDGPPVGVSQMSTGTADQLFLALRLAAVHEFLDHSIPMPFIADDLLINLDDGRAKAALEVLWELSAKTQVIFLTHHQHLVELGRETLGERVPVSVLSSSH